MSCWSNNRSSTLLRVHHFSLPCQTERWQWPDLCSLSGSEVTESVATFHACRKNVNVGGRGEGVEDRQITDFKDSMTLSVLGAVTENPDKVLHVNFFSLRSSSSPLLHCGFSHIFIHRQLQLWEEQVRRGVGCGEGMGGRVSCECGRSRLTWQRRHVCLSLGRTPASRNKRVFVFLSVCLCLVSSHNFALFFPPPLPRLSEGTNFFETSTRAVAQELKRYFLWRTLQPPSCTLEFSVHLSLAYPPHPLPLSCSLARSHTCTGAFPHPPPNVIPVMLSHWHMENSFAGSSHLLKRLSPQGPTQRSLMEKYQRTRREKRANGCVLWWRNNG